MLYCNTKCKMSFFCGTTMSVHLSTAPNTSSQTAQQQPENSPGSSLAPTPSSQPPSTDSPSLRSPQLTPQTSPGPQLSDLPSDNPHVEGGSLTTSSTPHSDLPGSSKGGEEEVIKVEEAKEAKSNKKQHLHCPTCKVTVNSSSQLEAHCSGVYYNTTEITLANVCETLAILSCRVNPVKMIQLF